MGIILDVIVVAIIAICVIIGAKRGFAKTAVETVGFFLAVYLSFSLCTPLATTIADKTIKPAVVSKIAESVPQTTQTLTNDAANTVWQALPEYVQNLASKADITPESLIAKVNAMSIKTDDQVIANVIADDVVMPLVYNLLKIVCAIILFIILLIITKLLAKLISGIFKLPLLKGLNKTVGAIFGGVQGVLFASVLCIIISAVISINSKGFLIFTPENIEASTLFETLSTFSPFK